VNEINQRVGGTSTSQSMAHLWKRIWRIHGLRVAKLFLWQAYSNILPTKENLHKWNITQDPICQLRCVEVKTVGHVLWNCPVARMFSRYAIQRSRKLRLMMMFMQSLDKLMGRLDDLEVELVACVARHLWLRQNMLVFGEDLLHSKTVYQQAVDQLEAYMTIVQDPSSKTWLVQTNMVEGWQAPDIGMLRIN
jgi:hypothetical protein